MSKRKSKNLLEQATETVEELVPVVEQSIGSAYESAKDVISEGRDLAVTAIGEVTTESKRRLGREKKKRGKGKLKTFLLLGVLTGLGAAAFKMLKGKRSEPAPWAAGQSPAPANTPAPPTPRAAESTNDVPPVPASPSVTQPEDQAGAAPGEALSDANEEARTNTTPDNPAEVVEVEKNEE